ncbi:ATPase, T2SS/T4P/T4SS family (plasmid) [Termitidicoccus mucosus]|uniref:ATPase, T2SS/T4P/T4SS family n=1 Tax=Termitidicoccus mucosus TaxID=1184151 RepID=UPI0031835BDD
MRTPAIQRAGSLRGFLRQVGFNRRCTRNDILTAIEAVYSPLPATNPKELLAEILNDAVTHRAADIHFEPKPQGIHIRYRIDNGMVHSAYYDDAMKIGLIQAIKNLAKLDLAQTKLPQDGQARHSIGSTTFNLRVNTLPTIRGEAADIRIQDETRDFGTLKSSGCLPSKSRCSCALSPCPTVSFT